MTDSLKDQHVLVIGAAGGIGTALLKHLTDDGVHVHATSRSEDRLSQIENAASTHILDATDANATNEIISTLAKENTLHGIVNLAGSIVLKPAHATTPDEFEDTFRTNLLTAFNVVRAASKSLQKQDDGASVVLMSSAVASHGFPAHEAIASTKAGVEALARSAAASYAPKLLRFNCVAPGLARTPLSQNIFDSEPMLKASLDMHADRNPAEPEQVASAIAWLLHPLQQHVTGQTIAIDGGLSRVHAK
jgi:NAD(P)-dependent dehydrogenase (short-subunit alcohol dehydrogenase family)